MLTSVEDVVNESLRAIGLKRRIASIYEGSPQSKAALEIYGQTRDEILRMQDWPFARGGSAVLALLKGPPPAGGYNPSAPWSTVYPPPGWLYEYAYPSDMIELRAIVPTPASLPELDPKAAVWRVDNDLSPVVSGNPPVAGGSPQKVILTNVPYAMAIYRRRVTNPALWEPGFAAVFIKTLAEKMALTLGQNIQAKQEETQETAAASVIADRHRG